MLLKIKNNNNKKIKNKIKKFRDVPPDGLILSLKPGQMLYWGETAHLGYAASCLR